MDPQTHSPNVWQRIKAIWASRTTPRTQLSLYGYLMLFVALILIGFAGILIPINDQLKHSSKIMTARELAELLKKVIVMSAMTGAFILMCAGNAFRVRRLLPQIGLPNEKSHFNAQETGSSSRKVRLQKMKRFMYAAVILIIACSISAYVVRRKDQMKNDKAREGIFMVTLGALYELRAGKSDIGIRTVEKVCFANADLAYARKSYAEAHAFTLIGFSTDDLIKYWSKYQTNRADWTDAEVRLDKRLSDLKPPQIDRSATSPSKK